MSNPRLYELKKQADSLNDEIVKIVNKKFGLMKEIAELKEQEKLPIRNRFVEEKLLDSIDNNTEIGFKEYIKEVVKTCLTQAEKLQGTYIFGNNNIWLIGMPGCGKSTVGKYLADSMCREYYDADDYFTSIIGMRPDICINSMGIDYFRDSETKVLGLLSKKKNCIVACGGGVVERSDNMQILRRNSTVIYIKRDLDKLATNGRPVSASVGVEALYERRHKAYEEWSDYEVKNNDIDECVKNIYDYLLKK